MNPPFKNFILAALFLTYLNVAAQDKGSIPDLVKEGIRLNGQGQYSQAIDQYNEALKLDPENPQANYQMAFSLLMMGKGGQGIAFLEKTIKASPGSQLTASCYDLLGSIYDQGHQTQKAIDAFKTGIQLNPKYQRLYYNLGLCFSRNRQYSEAEASAIEAIKLDPMHGGSLRMYALVCFHQNKRVNALMGFCSYLLLDPKNPLAGEAFGNIQHILQGGVLKDGSAGNTSMLQGKGSRENEVLNLAISSSEASGKNKKLRGADLLEYELKGIFSIAGQTAENKTDKSFFDKFFAEYFYKLAGSDNMPAFTRTISLSSDKEVNTKWMNENEQLLKQLEDWEVNTPRDF